MTAGFWYFTNCHWSGYGTDSVHALLLLTVRWAVLLLLEIFPKILGIWESTWDWEILPCNLGIFTVTANV